MGDEDIVGDGGGQEKRVGEKRNTVGEQKLRSKLSYLAEARRVDLCYNAVFINARHRHLHLQ